MTDYPGQYGKYLEKRLGYVVADYWHSCLKFGDFGQPGGGAYSEY